MQLKTGEPYPDAKKAEAADIAWEWLRRNCGDQTDYMGLAATERSGAMADHFRQQRGLSFCS
ncbi:transcriptional regulator domain-containing protein [Bradyrhizobium yuanmingense]|uniref:transcriptional regulator domain-containing protein n=1 Tax=Bradyrhizobium yuanmingense TaxID=108015 RepID=UPI003D2EE2C5